MEFKRNIPVKFQAGARKLLDVKTQVSYEQFVTWIALQMSAGKLQATLHERAAMYMCEGPKDTRSWGARRQEKGIGEEVSDLTGL